MLAYVGLWLLLAASQLDPALTPHKTPNPAVPKIDENACPFEGCRFGAWKATDDVQLYTTWKTDRKPLARVSKGDAVTAVTGVHIAFESTQIEVTAPMPDYGLHPGDTIFAYMNYGEGVFSAWFNGYWVEQFDGSDVAAPGDSNCRNCTAKVIKEGRMEWWVEIKTKDGQTGWIQETDKFDGNDALAGL
jgi:hypothetical protein